MIVPQSPPTPEETPGVLLHDPLPEAARKVVCFHFERMVSNEMGTILGQDEERLHDMRVAIRRMRVAMLVFEIPYSHKKTLRKTAKILGDVRDLDVFMEKTRLYQERLTLAERSGLHPLEQRCFMERNKVRERMLAYLGGEKYARIKAELNTFMEQWSFSAGLEAQQVCEVATGLVETRLHHVLQTGDGYHNPSIPQLHALRIAFKKLRYTIEFFVDVFEQNSYLEGLELLKRIQDCLGDIHDGWVAVALMQGFLEDFSGESNVQNSGGIGEYFSWRQSELANLRHEFSQIWHDFGNCGFKKYWVLKTS